ncbi:hypothetical protein GLYMA_11G076550v4 [Glycine max]|nr:hypothetical protein GLYMA_11G076550v4 [Glycine max]KAH1158063.1 hypothetical protein GYH30_030348 [Glycine max]
MGWGKILIFLLSTPRSVSIQVEKGGENDFFFIYLLRI